MRVLPRWESRAKLERRPITRCKVLMVTGLASEMSAVLIMRSTVSLRSLLLISEINQERDGRSMEMPRTWPLGLAMKAFSRLGSCGLEIIKILC